MSRSASESEDRTFSKDQVDSASVDEGSSKKVSKGGAGLKKGPWTTAEDAMLVDYVKNHGEGNWNAVQKHSGLSRCGKSCRLRWANHLRPNLKKGSFTADEERLIVELHAKLGNKWARMATQLPGRTDNEIKNYWNTRIKRRQRAGLPLYPPGMQVSDESHLDQDNSDFNSGNIQHSDQTNNLEIPDVVFENLKVSPGLLPYAPAFPDISASGMLTRGLYSPQGYNFMPTTMPYPKRLRDSDTFHPGLTGSVSNNFPLFDQFRGARSEMLSHPFGLPFPCETDSKRKCPAQFGAMPGSHAILNGNTSASMPTQRAVKLELPSLQYQEADPGNWGTSPPPIPLHESVDPYVRSPSPATLFHLDCPSPRNSGLLEALVYPGQTSCGTVHQPSGKSPNSSAFTPSEVVDGSSQNPSDMAFQESGDPISPLCRSADSAFSECSSISKLAPSKSSPVTNVKSEHVERVSAPKEEATPRKPDFSRPDVLLEAGMWFPRHDEYMGDTIASIFNDDTYSNCMHMGDIASSSNQGWTVGSNPWNNMPPVCQIFENQR